MLKPLDPFRFLLIAVAGWMNQHQELASKRRVKIRRVSLAQVRAAFARDGAVIRHEIAGLIARRFPELAPRYPAVRKWYEGEPYRMTGKPFDRQPKKGLDVVEAGSDGHAATAV